MGTSTGTAGNDSLTGGNSDDSLSGGAGNDSLYGGKGNDSLIGGSGNDLLDGGSGTDFAFFTGNFADYSISYDSAADKYIIKDNVAGRDGSDTLSGIEYFEFADLNKLASITIVGTAGNDLITGGSEPNELVGNAGDDTLIGGAGNDSLYGGAGNDSLSGGDGSDWITPGQGNDFVDGGAGSDYIDYGYDTGPIQLDLITGIVTGGSGNDTLSEIESVNGTSLNDFERGNDVFNILNGQEGDDTLIGGGGDDWLYGGKGNDVLTGGTGNDFLTGDGGTDTAVFSGNRSDYLVTTESVTGRLELVDTVPNRDGTDTFNAVEYFQFADGTVSVDQLQSPAPTIFNGTEAGDSIVGTSGADAINGLGGNDVLDAGLGNDSLYGGAGDDTLLGGAGNDVISGDAGRDTASYAGTSESVTVSLTTVGAQDTHGAGTDTLTGIENLIGGSGNDLLTGDTQDNVLQGGPGNDSLVGGAGLDVAVFNGLAANHAISVANGVVTVTDRLAGGDGTDTLTLIERLKFADEGIALDLGGNAGQVALTISAVFGPASIQNAHFVGLGLQQLDEGASAEALMQMALDARLGANATHKAVVDLLFTNIVGAAPTPAQEATYVFLLDSGQYTAGSLGVFAAQQPLNAANAHIELLASVGLVFEWFV
jgi:Ca2+-binding RTX toxin-like protein